MRKKRAAILSDSEGEDGDSRKKRPKITDTDNEDDGEKNEEKDENAPNATAGVVDGESSDEGVREGDNDNEHAG